MRFGKNRSKHPAVMEPKLQMRACTQGLAGLQQEEATAFSARPLNWGPQARTTIRDRSASSLGGISSDNNSIYRESGNGQRCW